MRDGKPFPLSYTNKVNIFISVKLYYKIPIVIIINLYKDIDIE